MIKTKRLLIRPIKIEDASDMYEYAKNPIIGKMAGWKAHQDLKETISIIEMLIRIEETYSIVYENKMIGTIGLTTKPEEVVIGYALSQDYWNKGIMHEALKATIIYLFTKTKNHTLVATTYLDNVKSQNVLLKLGFIFTDQVDRLVDNIYVKFNLYKLKKDAYERKELPWQNITTNT